MGELRSSLSPSPSDGQSSSSHDLSHASPSLLYSPGESSFGSSLTSSCLASSYASSLVETHSKPSHELFLSPSSKYTRPSATSNSIASRSTKSNLVTASSAKMKPQSSPASTPPKILVNYSAAFPTEINAMILWQLQRIGANGTVASCALVCRNWLPLVRTVLYDHPSQSLPGHLYSSLKKRAEWIEDWRNSKFHRLVEVLESDEFGPLVKGISMNASMDCETKQANVMGKLKEILSWLTNCDRLHLIGLHYPEIAEAFFAIASTGRIRHLYMAFATKDECGWKDLTLINIPRYLYRQSGLKSLGTLESLSLRQFRSFNAYEGKMERGEQVGDDNDKFQRSFVKPSWSLKSLELVRCSVVDPELRFIFGKANQKLRHVHFRRCIRSFTAATLFSIIQTHTPSGGLTSLILIQCIFEDNDEPEIENVVEKMVRISPNLVRLELEGKLLVSSHFLDCVIPSTIIILYIVPFDETCPENDLYPELDDGGNVFPFGFSPINWHQYLRSPRSTCLRKLTIGQSHHWTDDEIESLMKFSGGGGGQHRVSITVVGPVETPENIGGIWERTSEDELDDEEGLCQGHSPKPHPSWAR